MTKSQRAAARDVAILILNSEKFHLPTFSEQPRPMKYRNFWTNKEIESAVVYACTAVVNTSTILERSDPVPLLDGFERVENGDRAEVERLVKADLEKIAGDTPVLKWISS